MSRDFWHILIAVAILAIEVALANLFPQAPLELWLATAFVAFILLIIGVYGLWRSWQTEQSREEGRLTRNWLPMWELAKNGTDLHLKRFDKWPLRRVIPLHKAAKIARDKLIVTETGNLIENTSEAIGLNTLEWYARWLSEEGKTPLFGTRRASSVFQVLDSRELSRGRFVDDGQALRRFTEEQTLYENIHIKKSDFKHRLKKLKTTDATVAQQAT